MKKILFILVTLALLSRAMAQTWVQVGSTTQTYLGTTCTIVIHKDSSYVGAGERLRSTMTISGGQGIWNHEIASTLTGSTLATFPYGGANPYVGQLDYTTAGHAVRLRNSHEGSGISTLAYTTGGGGDSQGTRKKICFSYVNPSSTKTINVGIKNNTTGRVFATMYIGPGATYEHCITVLPTDTATYQTVVVDVDGAFAAGTVTMYTDANGINSYDFTGYTTAVGTGKTASDGVEAGQTPPGTTGISAAPGSGGTSAPINGAIASNPNAVPTGGTGAPTQGTDATNTNAITAAINSLKGAIGASGGGGTDVSGIHTRLDTANTHLEKMSKMADGTHPSQTGYNNDTQLGLANTKAGAVTPYAGLKPTVGGAHTNSIPGSATQKWGNWNKSVGTFTPEFSAAGISAPLGAQDALMVAGRSVLLVAVCLGFIREASRLVTKYTIAAPQVLAQDTGFGPENIGPGVSQAKTYATAAAAVAVIFGGIAAIVAVVDTYVTYYGGGHFADFRGD